MSAAGAGREPDAILPPRAVVYAQARELFEIADLARECAQAGPQADLPRAVRLLERARAILGEAHG